ncbi:peptidoglycan DD-metalloendopeptidase family protein [Anaerocolumna sedimenticola]|uniref:Peptidoglycan DD-metalloendopeptidase family protein n=1 Tax=Anaerocolumna sedimenticola TaxID=2696063 RepID=A0A6P1TJY4_9FIRM|nr:M23 family metallopeptidase [Anaerocolumna sedimenticola]QHQ60412.1 peptidoglycan DD-metalloendopeptidase family protein [Anaerocolumna sedimenticola]
MKKHSLAEFFKSKSFYALLCVGALAIVAITMVALNQTSNKDQGNNLVDLNEPIVSDVADKDNSNQTQNPPAVNNQASSTAANNKEGTSKTEVAQSNPNTQSDITEPVTDGSVLEFDAEDDPESVAANPTDAQDGTKSDSTTKETANAATTKDAADATEKTASSEPKKESEEVMTPDSLYFDTDDGLLWPVTGNILMDYSVDRVVYYETLEQFRVNPAVIIDAEIGTKVLSAAKGVITKITKEDETGTTVTVSLGNGFSVVYGQLDDLNVKVGDMVKEGQEIGVVAKPTKYFTVEGSNLYFQVLKNDKTVNPMLYLR